MKKFLFGVLAVAIVAAGTNYAIKVAADRMNNDDIAAAASAQDIRVQQANARVANKITKATKVDVTKVPAKTTTTVVPPKK